MADLTMKPCPFCGGEAIFDVLMATDRDYYRVECKRPSCDATGPVRKTESGAVKAWNRRKDAGLMNG